MNTIIENPITVPHHQIFDTLRQCYEQANYACGKTAVTASVIWHDRMDKPANRYLKLIGVTKGAGTTCQKIAPGGKWTLQANTTMGDYTQFMAWYSKFAPYALAMCQCEDGFQCLGIDYESINAYYQTVCGFNTLGCDEVIEEEDSKLFSAIYNKSCDLWSPQLPFDEAFRPCAVFLAVRAPKLFMKQFAGDMYHRHALEVLEAIDVEVPAIIKKAKLKD